MWEYNYSTSNCLEHRLVDGRQVKYIAKVPIGKNKYRYFYTNTAYQAYRSRGNSTIRTLKDGVARITKNGNKSSSATTKTIKKPLISKEYQEELAYNSKKNSMFGTSWKSSGTTSAKVSSASKEYWEAMGYDIDTLRYNNKTGQYELTENSKKGTSKKSSGTTSAKVSSASKEYWEAMGYDIDTLRYNNKTGQYELTENSKKGTSKKSSGTTSAKKASTKTSSDGPVIFTLNKNTGKTELVSGTSEMIQKGKSLIEELLEKLRR